MTVKLCPHFQGLPKWAGKVTFPGPWVKVMDPGQGISQRFPGKKVLGRWYVRDEARYIERGEAGADDYFRLLLPKYHETRHDLAAIEGPNEPPCQTREQVSNLVAFLRRWISLCHDLGVAVAAPAFSVGNPAEWVLGMLAEVWATTDYATLHEYGTRRIDEEWNTYTSLRHRWLNDWMAVCLDRQMPTLLITECGIDRGGDGYRRKPGNTPWPEYLRQLLWYESELQEDHYVEAAFVFTSGPTSTWTSFNVGEAEWRDLVRRLG